MSHTPHSPLPWTQDKTSFRDTVIRDAEGNVVLIDRHNAPFIKLHELESDVRTTERRVERLDT